FNLLMEHGDGAASVHVRRLIVSGRAPRPDRAVRALADWSGERAPAELATLLGEDPSLNESVFSRLRDARRRNPDAGRKELAAAFTRLFASPDRRIRRGAILAASELGLPFEGVTALVDDREASVRCAAIGAARQLALAGAAAAIEGKMDDDDPDVRVAAVGALAGPKPAARATAGRGVADEGCARGEREEGTAPPPGVAAIQEGATKQKRLWVAGPSL